MTDTTTTTQTTTQVLYPAMLGFERQAVYEGPNNAVLHAQLTFNGAIIMLGSSPADDDRYPVRAPSEVGGLSGSVYAYVADPDALYERAKPAGARIARELAYTDYGSREFSVYDCEGHFWTFGTYRP